MSRHAALLLLSLALPPAMGCVEPPEGPAAAALQLFEIARSPDPDEALLLDLFDPESADRERVALLETLDALAGLPETSVEEILQTDPQRAFVDLVTELDGGGSAGYTVRLRADDEGRWLVNWVQGPGIEWPRRRRWGDGLSTSAEP